MTDSSRTEARATNPARRKSLRVAGVIIWAVLVTTTIAVLTGYSLTPGNVAQPPQASDGSQSPNDAQFTLIMAVHPRCACTRASLDQLDRLLARTQGRVHAQILVYQPEGADIGWSETDLRTSAMRLPNTTVQIDLDGKRAAELGCQTSGSVVLYDRRGQPRFFGGITKARGHSGDSPGSDLIQAIVRGEAASTCSAPVFGCPLQTVQPTSRVAVWNDGGTQ